MSDFWDMSLTLKDSVDWGLSNIETLSEGGDYFLFDGFDSTLLGSYEVFEKVILTCSKSIVKNKRLQRTYYLGRVVWSR